MALKPNMGTVDRAVRVVAAIVIAGLYFGGVVSGAVATVLAVLAVIFLGTSAIGYCPLYAPLDISTRKH
ncbi:MAG: DUF2892 domain-containing protein [Gammaproteobacteria bacterium]